MRLPRPAAICNKRFVEYSSLRHFRFAVSETSDVSFGLARFFCLSAHTRLACGWVMAPRRFMACGGTERKKPARNPPRRLLPFPSAANPKAEPTRQPVFPPPASAFDSSIRFGTTTPISVFYRTVRSHNGPTLYVARPWRSRSTRVVRGPGMHNARNPVPANDPRRSLFVLTRCRPPTGTTGLYFRLTRCSPENQRLYPLPPVRAAALPSSSLLHPRQPIGSTPNLRTELAACRLECGRQ